jgi:hypothetical protein
LCFFWLGAGEKKKFLKPEMLAEIEALARVDPLHKQDEIFHHCQMPLYGCLTHNDMLF